MNIYMENEFLKSNILAIIDNQIKNNCPEYTRLTLLELSNPV